MEGLHLCLCKNAKLAHHIARNSWRVTPLQQCRQVTIEDQQHHWGKESMCTLPGGPRIFSRLFNHICGLSWFLMAFACLMITVVGLTAMMLFICRSWWHGSPNSSMTIYNIIQQYFRASDLYTSFIHHLPLLHEHQSVYILPYIIPNHTYTNMEWWVIDCDNGYISYASCAPPLHVNMVSPRSIQLNVSKACPSDHVLRQRRHQLELSLHFRTLKIGCMMALQLGITLCENIRISLHYVSPMLWRHTCQAYMFLQPLGHVIHWIISCLPSIWQGISHRNVLVELIQFTTCLSCRKHMENE